MMRLKNRNCRTTLAATAGGAMLSLALASASQAAIIASFGFGTLATPTLAPDAVNPTPGITVSAITAGAGIDMATATAPSATSPSYNTTAPMLSAGAGTNVVNSLDNAETNNVYFTFTITPDAGVTFSLDTLSLLAGRSAASSTRQWGFYTSATGYTVPVLSDTITQSRGDGSLDSDGGSLVSTLALQNISAPLVVRFYINPGTGGSANAGRKVDIDNIMITGTTVIPEPVSLALLGLGGLCLLPRRQRRVEKA